MTNIWKLDLFWHKYTLGLILHIWHNGSFHIQGVSKSKFPGGSSGMLLWPAYVLMMHSIYNYPLQAPASGWTCNNQSENRLLLHLRIYMPVSLKLAYVHKFIQHVYNKHETQIYVFIPVSDWSIIFSCYKSQFINLYIQICTYVLY